jgi:hypothetical protein
MNSNSVFELIAQKNKKFFLIHNINFTSKDIKKCFAKEMLKERLTNL